MNENLSQAHDPVVTALVFSIHNADLYAEFIYLLQDSYFASKHSSTILIFNRFLLSTQRQLQQKHFH